MAEHKLRARLSFSYLMIFLLAFGTGLAQNSEITGVVTDQSQAVIPGVEVTVTNADTGVPRATISDDLGNYSVPLLRDGNYIVRASMTGFSTQEAELRLEVAQVARLDFQLAIGQIGQVVEVAATAEVINYKTSDVGQVIDEKRISELPLNGRNYLELAQLSSGVVRANTAGRGTRTGAEGGFVANGQHVAQNTVYLDGTEISSKRSRGPLGFQAQAVQPNVEALSEFKVITNNTSAEYGYRTGASVLVSTKSGTNQFHGSVFEFHRNAATQANDFFFNRNARPGETGAKTPQYIRNQYGATFGGPVIRDRTFFFASFQGTKIRRGATQTVTVPSAAARMGDFSQEPGGIGRNTTIFDPLTLAGEGVDAERQPFPGNRLPAERMDPVSQSILNLFPLPNVAGRENLPFNFFTAPGLATDFNQYDFRVDHNLNDSNRIFGRYSLRDELRASPGPFELPANDNMGQIEDMVGHNVGFGWSSAVSSSLHNEFRFGWTWFDTAFDIPATENLNDQFGIQNAVGSMFGQHDLGLARFRSTGFSDIGSRCCWPNDDELLNTQFADNVLWNFSNHSLKFGGEYKYLNKRSVSARQNRGMFTFNGQYTAQFPNRGASRVSQGHSIADFLLGWANGGSNLGPAGEDTNHPYWAFYVQDDWKVTPRLTVNLGLRWELFRGPFHRNGPDSIGSQFVLVGDPQYEALDDDFIEVFDAEFQEWRLPEDGSDCACRPDKNNLAPRVGFAYQATSNTVIRGGGGIYYGDQDFLGISDGRFYGNNAANVRGSQVIPNFEQASLRVPILPDLSPTAPLDQLAPNTPGTVVIPEFLPTTYSAQWFLDVQHRLPWDTVLTIGYNGNATSHQSRGRLVSDPGPHPDLNWQGRERFPGRNPRFLTKYDNILNANYNAMVFKAEKRFSDGLTFLSSFTWQHSLDYGTELFTTTEGTFITHRISDTASAYGRSGLDRKLAYNASFMYELPGPKDGPAGAVLGGWQVGGILSLLHGPPFDTNFNNTILHCLCKARGNVVEDPNLPESQRTVERWFNTDFAENVTRDDVAEGRYGSAGRNLVWAPGWKSFDLLVSKNFYMPWEGHHMQFRFEAFNMTNTPHFGRPATNLDRRASVGIINAVEDPRLIQFALRYVF